MVQGIVLSIVKWLGEKLITYGLRLGRLHARLSKIEKDIAHDTDSYEAVAERVRKGEATDEDLKEAARRYLNTLS